MKWVFVHLICCGGLLLLILLGANASLVLGLVADNLLVLLVGLTLIAIGVYYAWRRKYLKCRSDSDASSSPVHSRKGQD